LTSGHSDAQVTVAVKVLCVSLVLLHIS